MTATMRLFTIEARRSIALWFFPLLVLVTCWYANDRLSPVGIMFWAQSSAQIGEALIILGPLMGGVAAWAAGRDRRRGMGDLLATTSQPASRRLLAIWGGVMVWGLAAYALVAAFVVVVSLHGDAWGTPNVEPVVVGLLAIGAASAIGFLVGSVIPSRFAPPLVPIGLFLAMGLLNSGWFFDDPVSYLSPWTLLDRQLFGNPDAVFYQPYPVHLLPMSLWLGGLTGLALGAAALVRRRSVLTWATLAGSATLALAGATLLLAAYDDKWQVGNPWEWSAAAPYSPVCVERTIQVCAHPAFEQNLDRRADQIERLVEPLLGIPGAPVRAEQLAHMNGLLADGTLVIDMIATGVEVEALALVQAPVEPEPGWLAGHYVDPVQDVIGRWLARRVDPAAFDHWWDRRNISMDGVVSVDPIQDDINAAVDRFAALDVETQRRWLEVNYADLRAGRLTLDDLP